MTKAICQRILRNFFCKKSIPCCILRKSNL
nr:MAG TPA: hypothetical protein [Caudoviricetes sp.]DAL30340.1 MAG TPA_asm: hypothetical protein [Caudoviricetes sp.]DAM68734.1 MAG TPA: hypothetical protein [Caudoviricetes sp.]DAT99201.1 MAG TPA: hypothetical protein [Caudoviricetes sp.]DAY50871.1 MAG TPA: hypothetical protein [Caudoviricetes sp.]